MDITPPPIQEQVMIRGLLTQIWVKWFNQLYKIAQAVNPSVSSDNGDAAVTLTAGKNALIQRWATAITADRAVTLSTTGAYTGATFRVVRESTATGAFNLNVGTGPLKALAAGTWCDVAFNGTAWQLTGYGSL